MASPASADYAGSVSQEDVKRVFKTPGYSPYAGRNFPTKVLWGDTHLHTGLFLDARAFGVILGPEDAYRLARGEEIAASYGERVMLSRALMREPLLKDWHERINAGGDTALAATMEVIEIPTPRWTAYDAKRYGVTMDKEVPMVTQERAYTSPIWYTP